MECVHHLRELELLNSLLRPTYDTILRPFYILFFKHFIFPKIHCFHDTFLNWQIFILVLSRSSFPLKSHLFLHLQSYSICFLSTTHIIYSSPSFCATIVLHSSKEINSVTFHTLVRNGFFKFSFLNTVKNEKCVLCFHGFRA